MTTAPVARRYRRVGAAIAAEHRIRPGRHLPDARGLAGGPPVPRVWGGGQAGATGTLFHRKGRRVVEFRTQWEAACKAAKVAGLLFHDLRRSAVRNLEQSGVSQSVAMKITGHRTVSVYQRYRIIDEGDIARALATTQAATRQTPGNPS